VVQLDVVVVNETAGLSRTFEYLYRREQVELSADRTSSPKPGPESQRRMSGPRPWGH
jgi:hypothetical protein